MKKRMRNRKGFTLIELIVVIAILGILAAIMIPRFTGFQNKARATQVLVDAKQIATAIDAYNAENDDWPDSEDADDVTYIRNLSGVVGGDLTMDGDGSFVFSRQIDGNDVKAGRIVEDGVPGPVEFIE